MRAGLGGAWVVWLSLTAWRYRPIRKRQLAPTQTVDSGIDHRERFDAVGRALLARLPVLAPLSPRFLTWCVLLAPTSLALVGPLGPAAAAILAVLGRSLGLRAQRRDHGRFVDELAEAVELMRIATAGGLTAGPSIAAVVRHGSTERVAGLDVVVERVRRGRSLHSALTEWEHMHGTSATELASLIRASDRSGVAIGPGLGRLASDLRRRRRIDAESRARRLPVTMLAPLVICVLPAFGLITVVPTIVVGLSSLNL